MTLLTIIALAVVGFVALGLIQGALWLGAARVLEARQGPGLMVGRNRGLRSAEPLR